MTIAFELQWLSTDLCKNHVLFFNNATTHTKQPDGSLSARYMPKKTSSAGKNWGVEITACNTNGKPIYRSNGKTLKKKINMQYGLFADRSPQPLYFESGPHVGLFKGMAVILMERGMGAESKLHAKCKKFKGPSNSPISCCWCHMLYNQPDFVQVDSISETVCQACSYKVIFLPKFHCKLNFIEQCWGYAKQTHWHYPPSWNWSCQICVIGTQEHPSCQHAKVCNLIMLVCRCLPTWSYWKASCMGRKHIPRASCDAWDPPSWLRWDWVKLKLVLATLL